MINRLRLHLLRLLLQNWCREGWKALNLTEIRVNIDDWSFYWPCLLLHDWLLLIDWGDFILWVKLLLLWLWLKNSLSLVVLHLLRLGQMCRVKLDWSNLSRRDLLLLAEILGPRKWLLLLLWSLSLHLHHCNVTFLII